MKLSIKHGQVFFFLNKKGVYGFSVNNLHNGKGFSLYLGELLIWHQAWFGKINQASWYDGKFRLVFPFIRKRYSPLRGWEKL